MLAFWSGSRRSNRKPALGVFLKMSINQLIQIIWRILINLGSELLRICPTNSNKIEVSTNDGRIWSSRYSGSSCGAFYDLTSYGSEIIAITSKGVYVSTNGGRIWSSRYTSSSCGDFQSISANGSELFSQPPAKDLYDSKNGGRSWSKRRLRNCLTFRTCNEKLNIHYTNAKYF